MTQEFSFRTRQENIRRLEHEVFDLLVVGGGITGVSVARDATTRGLKVALVEKGDFAQGTSSRSSKLIHGGLRYLENFEFGLVYEALRERTFLLKTVPHLVRPLPFLVPVYKGDPHPPWKLSLGLTLYDLLSLFHAPQMHSRLSVKQTLKEIPFLLPDALVAGFKYFDASMWDDVLAIEIARCAQSLGAVVTSFVEATSAIQPDGRVSGLRVLDHESGRTFDVQAHQVVACAGPWADQFAQTLSQEWTPWLGPSQGAHLVFDQAKIPIESAMVMSHPEDGRISFVIPRPDFGNGLVIVGTTDGPSPKNPDAVETQSSEVQYLLRLLNNYYPGLKLSPADILGTYVGIRPLMRSDGSLQKASREHHIGRGPRGTVFVVGGKYTTHRLMAQEIVDFALKAWQEDAAKGEIASPRDVGPSRTKVSSNVAAAAGVTLDRGWKSRYGGELDAVLGCRNAADSRPSTAFPELSAQVRFSVRHEMAIHLEDLLVRRIPVNICSKDGGGAHVDVALSALASERGLTAEQTAQEKTRYLQAIQKSHGVSKL